MWDNCIVEDIYGGILTKDIDVLKGSLKTLKTGDSITLYTKTFKGSIYKYIVTAQSNGKFEMSKTIKGKKPQISTDDILSVVDEMIYFITMTGGSIPKITINRV